jgi:recombination protein RecA
MTKPEAGTIASKLAELRKKDATLRIGSLADFDTEVKVMTTGNVALDNAIGVGGFPRGRVIELFGPSQSGKTTSALQTAAAHQARVKAGTDEGAILYLDYENSLDRAYCANLGLDTYDPDTFVYFQPESLEQGCNVFRELMSTGLLAIGIFDSVAAMVSEKELEAETGAITVGDRAKALHQFMRQVKGPLRRSGAMIIFLNHVMDVIETSVMGRRLAAQGVKRKTTPGGTSLVFYSDLRIEFSQVGTHKSTVFNPVTNESEDIVTATTVQAKVVKNKVSKPQRIARMRVRYGKGFSQPYSVFSVLLAHKVIKKSGSWITVPANLLLEPEPWKFQGEEPILLRLENDPELLERSADMARRLVAEWTPDKDTDDFEVDPSIDPETGEVKDAFSPHPVEEMSLG